MKKKFFTALACIAFAGSGFASNEIINNLAINKENLKTSFDFELFKSQSSNLVFDFEEVRPCSWKAAVIGLDGMIKVVEGSTKDKVTKDGCRKAADGWAAATHQITPIVENSLDVVWGDRL